MKPEELEISACEDVTTEVPISFSNLASTPNKYYLHLTAPGFAELSQEELELQGKGAAELKLTLKPTQKDVGEYNVVLSAATEYGDMLKDKNFKLKINDCFASDAKIKTVPEECGLNCAEKPASELWLKQLSDKDCPSEKTYSLNIRNDGMYEEAYEVVVDSPGWVSIKEEDQFVRIKPGQNINIPVTVKFINTDAKQASFIMVKQLREPYQSHEIKIELESLSQRTCYNIDLLQDKYRINYDTSSISMLLKSTGMRKGTYALKLGELDSKFVYLDQETMEFQPGEIKVLHVYPRNYSDYKQGTYLNKLTLTISLVGGDVKVDYDRQFWVVLKDKNFLPSNTESSCPI